MPQRAHMHCILSLLPCAVLVGSGRRALGALIVPNSEALEELAKERGEHD